MWYWRCFVFTVAASVVSVSMAVLILPKLDNSRTMGSTQYGLPLAVHCYRGLLYVQEVLSIIYRKSQIKNVQDFLDI